MIVCFFLFQFSYMVDYIDRCLYIKPFPHLWDKAYLIMVDDLFDVYLDSLCFHGQSCHDSF